MFRNKQKNKKTNQQIILRTNRLLSFDTARTTQKTTPPEILRYNRNVFTEAFIKKVRTEL
jgi:hypothetical protein